ncbi:hypothetical protein HMPREF3034_01913 [Prevotella sp. DNF00663]|nr:hypothetical protein HMPREF3034_01913 [Prevotella sp. DNF00663]
MWYGKGSFLSPSLFGEPLVIDRIVAVGVASAMLNEGDNGWGEAFQKERDG